MADYQLLGYHPGYPPNQQNAAGAGQSTAAGMMGPGGMLPGAGHPPPGMAPPPPGHPHHPHAHHQAYLFQNQTRPPSGYPGAGVASDPLMSHKLHASQYSAGGYPGAPGRGQYSAQNYMSPVDSYGLAGMGAGGPTMGSGNAYDPHMMGSYGHGSATPGSSNSSRMQSNSSSNTAVAVAGSSSHSSNSSSGAASQRQHSSSTLPSQYPGYSGQSSAYGGGGSDLWPSSMSSGQSSMPFPGYAPPPGLAPSSNSSSVPSATLSSSSRLSSQYGSTGATDYPSAVMNPYFPNHLPPGSDPYANYSGLAQSSQQQSSSSSAPGSAQAQSSSANSGSGRSSTRGSGNGSNSNSAPSNVSQLPFGGGAGPQYGAPSGASNVSAAASRGFPNAAASSHYSHYPSAFDPTGSSSRLAPPYGSGLPGGPGQAAPSSSPQYRGGYSSGSSTPAASSQLPVPSPRRPTPPASGSPMQQPATSHTPGPPSVGSSNSTQGSSNHGSGFTASAGTGNTGSSGTSGSGPSSLQQLEQMVMPHIGGSSSSTTSGGKDSSGSANNSTPSAFYSVSGSGGANANNTSSPIHSPQQSQQQSGASKLYSSYSPSTGGAGQQQQPPASSQYPYQPYGPGGWPPPPSAASAPGAPGSSGGPYSNTHAMKSNKISSDSSNTNSSNNTSGLHQPYASYGSGGNKPSGANEQHSSMSSADGSDFSPYPQPSPVSSSSHVPSSSATSSSSSIMSHSLSSQSGYSNSNNLSSYDNSSSKQQSASKNDTQNSNPMFDPMKRYDPSGSMNSYHHPMMPPSSHHHPHQQYPPQGPGPAGGMYGAGPNGRFDPYGSGGDMTGNSSSGGYGNGSGAPSSMYDPYNIDNIGMPPPPQHQTMSEYREQQQSGSSSSATASDPYAYPSFDEYGAPDEAAGKRKGKGRPKKQDANLMPGMMMGSAPPPPPKKERKPRQPRTPSTRGTGRGRGRGAKSAMMSQPPMPGMMDYDGSMVGPYGMPPGVDPSGSMTDMYGNGPPPPSSMDMYGSPSKLMSPGGHRITPGMMIAPPPSNAMLSQSQTPLPPMGPNDPMVMMSSPHYGGPPPPPSMSTTSHHSPQLMAANGNTGQIVAPPSSVLPQQQQSSPSSIGPQSVQPQSSPYAMTSMDGLSQSNVPSGDSSSYPGSYQMPDTLSSQSNNMLSSPQTTTQSQPAGMLSQQQSTSNVNQTGPNLSQQPTSLPSRPSSSLCDKPEQMLNTSTSSSIGAAAGYDERPPSSASSYMVDQSMDKQQLPPTSDLAGPNEIDQVVLPQTPIKTNTDMSDMSVNEDKTRPNSSMSYNSIEASSGQNSQNVPSTLSVNAESEPQQQQQNMSYPKLEIDSSSVMATQPPPSSIPGSLYDQPPSTMTPMPSHLSSGMPMPGSFMGSSIPPDYGNGPYGLAYPPPDPSMSYGGLPPPPPPPTTSTPLPEEKKKPRQRKSKKDQPANESVLNESTLPLDSSLDASLIEGDTPTKPAKKKRQTKKAKQAEEIDDFDDKTQSTMEEDSYLLLPKKPKTPKRPRKAKVDTSIVYGDDASNATTELNGDTNTTAGDSLMLEPDTDEMKPKKPKVKKVSPKKKLPKLALKFKANKKKRRGFGSPDNSDIEKTPPPSPVEGEDISDKRRSARNTKRQRYNDDIDLDLSDDDLKETEQVVNNVTLTEDTMVVEKIMATRMAKREIEPDDEDEEEQKANKVVNGEDGADENKKVDTDESKEKNIKVLEPQFIEVEEFYVKYKNLSYLHCDWKTEEELEKGDRRVAGKIKRYRQKKDVNMFDFLDDEPFNPDYVEVDRVLDVNEVEEIYEEEEGELVETKKEQVIKEEPKDETKSEQATKVEEGDKTDSEEEKPKLEETKIEEDFIPIGNAETSEMKKKIVKKTRTMRHFLVKWRGLAYEESTWELEDDIDPVKIVNFYKFRDPPTSSERSKIKKRPRPNEWRKMSASPVYKNGNTLREYQLEGLNWLNFCWHNGQNCILADEMGLGKTIQSIAFVQQMVNYGIPYPYLIIVPLSTIGNWQREFETWTELNVVTYHGTALSREMLQKYELYYHNEKNERIPNVYKFQVMITTFEVILSDCAELSSIKWVACIIDEAHRLKNRNCKLLEGLRQLQIDHRVLLTGTPLQNNVEELFSLLNFLEPSQFTSNENFMSEFGDCKTEAQVDKLKAILKPMMLRRLKEDVEKSLAPKEETIIEVELTNVQKKYYRAILERNFQFLSKGGTYANMPNLMNTVMELRKCCIHPFLINGAEEQIIYEFRQQSREEGGGESATLDAIIKASGKLVLIDKLLPRLKENGHRVLIFSQMVRCLDILEDYLCQKRYPYERIDGRVRGNLRQAAIDRFSKPDSDRFVFLLCTRAGGLGINLTAADTVIIFDSDWNPQNDLQAQARCHRIGQKKSVKVYRLICKNTYEREMFDRASLKLGLDKAVLQSMNAQKNVGNETQLTKKEIEDLLRKGAYGALMDDDNAGDKFCEEDIDQILQRRTQKIIIESEGKGSTFSKATFASNADATDIDIDDPNFWEKWARKANFDVDELKNRNELIMQEPRRRTQTKRFGADDAVMDISDLETDSEEDESISSRTRGGRIRGGVLIPNKKRRKGRHYDPENDEDYAQEIGFGWTRNEFFKVEKGLLTFGWDRWEECRIMANFKRILANQDVEDISRVILLFALQNYKGDEKVKSFILELITPPSEKDKIDSNDAMEMCEGEGGCMRRKKKAKTVGEELETLDWTKTDKYNPELHLIDDMYKKHLLRHANKILLRVRLLAYIKNDIIGDLHEKVMSDVTVRDIPIPYCQPDGEPPAVWWDDLADRSLVVGVYKHGYDRYNHIRQDASLCFLERCGAGETLIEAEDDKDEAMEEDDESKTPATPAVTDGTSGSKDTGKEGEPSPTETGTESVSTNEQGETTQSSPTDNSEMKPADAGSAEQSALSAAFAAAPTQVFLPYPTSSELNNRLRRLITSYQRNFKREEMRMAQKVRLMQRLEKMEKNEATLRERERCKRDQAQKKWSRREEGDFYKTISSFGIEFDAKNGQLDWTRFRQYAKLERKLDETLTEYYKAFSGMCKKVVGRALTLEEENLPISVDQISEDKANRCLSRIELLSKLRNEVLTHPELDERLKLCQPQLDLPEWWVCGKHDKDLLIGAARYGLSKLDTNLMVDPTLSFIEIVQGFEAAQAAADRKAKEDEDLVLNVKALIKEVVNQVDLELKTEDKLVKTNDEDKDMEVGDEVKTESTEVVAEEEKMEISFKEEHQTENEICQQHPHQNSSLNDPVMSSMLMTMPQPRPTLKWPRERVLQIRLENICLCVEKNEWPTFRGFNSINANINNFGFSHSTTPSVATADSSPRPSTPCSISSASQETPHPTPDHTPRRESQSPFTGDFFYSSTNSLNNMLNSFDDGNRKKRRKRRSRYESGKSQSQQHMSNTGMGMGLNAGSLSSGQISGDRTKLQSLLNSKFDPQQQSLAAALNALNSTLGRGSSQKGGNNNQQGTIPISANALAQSLFKNNKISGQNSAANTLFNSPLLSPLLQNLPFNLRSELFANDEKASMMLNSTLQTALAAMANAANKQQTAGTSSSSSGKGSNFGHEKSTGHNAPPPAHQNSGSRNSLPLGTLDLTSKFKSAASASSMLDKANLAALAAASAGSSQSSSRGQGSFGGQRSSMGSGSSKNRGGGGDSEKIGIDVLDLSSMQPKGHGTRSSQQAISDLLNFKKTQEQMKNSALMTALFNQQISNLTGGNAAAVAAASAKSSSPSSTAASTSSNQKKKGKSMGIDQLALSLQAKKMMADGGNGNSSQQQDFGSIMKKGSSSSGASSSSALGAGGGSSGGSKQKMMTESELFAAAFGNLGGAGSDKKRLDELNAQNALLQSLKANPKLISGDNASQLAAAAASMIKKPTSAAAVNANFLDSLKMFSKLSEGVTGSSSSNANPKDVFMEKMRKFMEANNNNPNQLAAMNSFLTSSAFKMSPNMGLGSLASPSSLSSFNQQQSQQQEDKNKSTRSSKRNRSQFDSSSSAGAFGNETPEQAAKRMMLNMPSSKNNEFKYLSSLLDKSSPSSLDVDAKLKNMIKEKSFKTPTSMAAQSSSTTSNTSKTRSSSQDKQRSSQQQQSSSSGSSRQSAATSSSSASNFANMNASNLLNTLSLTAAAQGGSSSSSSPSSKQQQQANAAAAAAFLNYPFGGGAAGKTGAGSGGSASSAFANQAAAAAAFSNFAAFTNPSLMGNYPSMKMILDAVAAASPKTSSAGLNTSSAATPSSNSAGTSSSTTTTSSASTAAAAAAAATPSLASFASLFGMSNPMLNFGNMANMASLSQQGAAAASSSNKSVSSSLTPDLAALASSLAGAGASHSTSSASGGEDKQKSKASSSSTSTSSSGGSKSSSGGSSGNKSSSATSAATAAAAANLLSTMNPSALPFLYSNPNFASLSQLYNPMNFPGLSSSFLSNPNLMNGLANFSGVFTSTSATPTTSSSSKNKAQTLSSSSHSGGSNSRRQESSSNVSATPGGSNSGRSHSSGRSSGVKHNEDAAVAAQVAAVAAALDSEEEDLKELMDNDDNDDDEDFVVSRNRKSEVAKTTRKTRQSSAAGTATSPTPTPSRPKSKRSSTNSKS